MPFPSLIPSSRQFKPSQFPVSRQKMMAGNQQAMLYANTAYKAQLRLRYANRTLADVERFLDHYDGLNGTQTSFQFTSEWTKQVWGGWDAQNGDAAFIATESQWRYQAAPRLTQVKRGIGTIEVNLVQVPGSKAVLENPAGTRAITPTSTRAITPLQPRNDTIDLGPDCTPVPEPDRTLYPNPGPPEPAPPPEVCGGGGGGGLPQPPGAAPINPGTPIPPPAPEPEPEPPCLGPDGQPLPEGMPCPPSYVYPSPGLDPEDPTKVPFYFWTFRTWLNLGGHGGSFSCYDGTKIGNPRPAFNGMGYFVFEDVIACAVRISCVPQYKYRICAASLGGNGNRPTEGWPLTYLLRLDKWDIKTGTWVFGDASNRVLFDDSYRDPPRIGNTLYDSNGASWTEGGNFRTSGPFNSYFPKKTVLTQKDRIPVYDQYLAPGDTPPPVGPAPEDANGEGGLNELRSAPIELRAAPAPRLLATATTNGAEFPAYTPSRRVMKYGDWNTKRFGGGNTGQSLALPLPSKAMKRDVLLDLVYANTTDSVARTFLNHYLSCAGEWADFALPAEKLKTGPMAGWADTDSERFLSKGRWAYAGAPQVTSVHPGTSTVTLQLISLETEDYMAPPNISEPRKPLPACEDTSAQSSATRAITPRSGNPCQREYTSLDVADWTIYYHDIVVRADSYKCNDPTRKLSSASVNRTDYVRTYRAWGVRVTEERTAGVSYVCPPGADDIKQIQVFNIETLDGNGNWTVEAGAAQGEGTSVSLTDGPFTIGGQTFSTNVFLDRIEKDGLEIPIEICPDPGGGGDNGGGGGDNGGGNNGGGGSVNLCNPDGGNINPPPAPPAPPLPTPEPEPEPPLREPEAPDCCPDAVGDFVVNTKLTISTPTTYYCNRETFRSAAREEEFRYEFTFRGSDIRVWTSTTTEYIRRCAGPFDVQLTAPKEYVILCQGAGCNVPGEGVWFGLGVNGNGIGGGQGESTHPNYVTVPKVGGGGGTSFILKGEIVSITKDGKPFTAQRMPGIPKWGNPSRGPTYDCDNCCEPSAP